MRGLAYAIAAVAAVGIMFVIATMPTDQTSEPTETPTATNTQTADNQTAENAEVLASATTDGGEGGMLTLAVPEMHCEFACFPKVKETLEGEEGVELVELGPQKEEGAIDNRQVIVKYKAGFDAEDAIAKLTKAGFDDSEVVPVNQIDSERSRGVLLVGHGSRDQQGTAQFFQLANRLAESVSPMIVEPALLEFQTPTIEQGWNSLISGGIKHVHVAPLLLFAAGHARRDIPDAIAKCVRATPGVTFDQSLPLSRHRSIIHWVAQQIDGLIAQQVPGSRIALVMVGRGSHDPCAQADMRILSALIGNRLGIAKTYTAFYAMAQPQLTDVLSMVASSGNFDCIIVHPHLLFAGRLHQAIQKQTEQVSDDFPSVIFSSAPYLGPTKYVAKAIADRICQCERSLTGNFY